jgi:hypothetical protein
LFLVEPDGQCLLHTAIVTRRKTPSRLVPRPVDRPPPVCRDFVSADFG